MWPALFSAEESAIYGYTVKILLPGQVRLRYVSKCHVMPDAVR